MPCCICSVKCGDTVEHNESGIRGTVGYVDSCSGELTVYRFKNGKIYGAPIYGFIEDWHVVDTNNWKPVPIHLPTKEKSLT